MAEIHNSKQRMPLILSPHEETDWLSGHALLPDFSNRSDVNLEAWEIDKKRILGPEANSEGISQRYCNNLPEQKGLFD